MSKTAEALNPTVYGLPTSEPLRRSNLTEILKTNGRGKQIGWVFEDGQLAGTKDCTIVGARKKDGRPILNETEGMSRTEVIWQRFKIEEVKMRNSGDNRHLFLLRRGLRIEGLGRYRWISGNITNDWLIARKPGSIGKMTIYSFNERGSGVFSFIRKNKFGENVVKNVGKDVGFSDYGMGINLNRLKVIDDLEKIINPLSTKS